jgi:uncharacterized protein (DUF488 family)
MTLLRCRVLQRFLQCAERPVDRVELVKWAFLLRHTTTSRGGTSFYRFLPHRRGPYSFVLRHEVDRLVETKQIDAHEKTWSQGKAVSGSLPQNILQDVEQILSRYSCYSQRDLLAEVYERFPWFTVNSECESERRYDRPSANTAVYTTGYEGEQVDSFLNRLMVAGIRRVVDVRSNPIARRFGFHRSTLSRLCSELQIDYISVPELGISSAERQGLDDSLDRMELLNDYQHKTLPANPIAIQRISELMTERASTLLCLEAEACRCHRSRLALAVAQLTALPVVHLNGTSNPL